MKFHNFLSLVFFILISFNLYSQNSDPTETDDLENFDDLFDNAEEDIIVEETDVDNRSQFETSEKIKFSGSFNALALAGIGWTNWNMFKDIKDGFDVSAGFQADFKVNLDIRPAPQIRVFASLATEFDPFGLSEDSKATDKAIWKLPYLSDLYCDYILAETLYTRFGKFTMGWGQGRFYTPGNIMSRSSDSSLNLKFSLPTLYGLSLVVLTNNSLTYRDFSYGAKIDFVFGETMISPGVIYDAKNGLSTLLSLKRVLFKTDFLIDFTTNMSNSLLQSSYIVAGFFHKWSTVTLYGEYQFNWLRDNPVFNHEASIAVQWSKPLQTPFDLGIKLMQNFVDGSGTVTLGLNQMILPFLELKIALPIVYGVEGSSAVVNNKDPSDRRIALVVALKLTTSF